MEILSFQFLHELPGLADAGSPRNVMSFRPTYIIVFEMQANNPSLQFFYTFHRIKSRFNPMADVATRPHQRGAIFDRRQNGIRIPVNGMALGVFMNGNLDIVFLAKFFDRVQSIQGRLSHQSMNVPFFCELEYLAALRFTGQINHPDIDEGPMDAVSD